jgi:hypothetical protein
MRHRDRVVEGVDMARRTVKPLLRLYPRSWRARYGREMETLVDEMPSDLGVALDLLIGAVRAYAVLVAGNRVLSGAAGFLQGVCVGVLLQGIAFLTVILFAERGNGEAQLQLGPIYLATIQTGTYLLQGELRSLGLQQWPGNEVVATVVLLVLILAALTAVVAAPRLSRALE